VQKSILLAAIQKKIHRHDLSYFVDDPPSVAQGGVSMSRGDVLLFAERCQPEGNYVL
jgi:hypothetical protein